MLILTHTPCFLWETVEINTCIGNLVKEGCGQGIQCGARERILLASALSQSVSPSFSPVPVARPSREAKGAERGFSGSWALRWRAQRESAGEIPA